LTCCVLALLAGCGSGDNPDEPGTSEPNAAAQPAEQGPEQSVILPESHEWSREEALAKLSDEAAGVSAAVRLVRLAEVEPLCVPDPLPPRIAERLCLAPLSDSQWALGWSVGDDERRLQSVALIGVDGSVQLPVGGVEEEVSVLHVSDDADVFPHLLFTPLRVMTVGDGVEPAITAKSLGGSRFALRRERGIPYVALVWRGLPEAKIAEPIEVARYTWDPYELTFMGPAADKLPDPPGGRFEMDLKQSHALVPVGGEIGEPDPVEEYVPPEEREVEGGPPPY
jgi:hypothetical protein